VVARVTAFLEKRNFAEGAEVKTGDSSTSWSAARSKPDLASKKAQVAQMQATLVNAQLTTGRAKALLRAGRPAIDL